MSINILLQQQLNGAQYHNPKIIYRTKAGCILYVRTAMILNPYQKKKQVSDVS
jgi:hypothetical protein